MDEVFGKKSIEALEKAINKKPLGSLGIDDCYGMKLPDAQAQSLPIFKEYLENKIFPIVENINNLILPHFYQEKGKVSSKLSSMFGSEDGSPFSMKNFTLYLRTNPSDPEGLNGQLLSLCTTISFRAPDQKKADPLNSTLLELQLMIDSSGKLVLKDDVTFDRNGVPSAGAPHSVARSNKNERIEMCMTQGYLAKSLWDIAVDNISELEGFHIDAQRTKPQKFSRN